MRKITQEATIAFNSNRDYSLNNTKVKAYPHCTTMYLHNNEIAINSKGVIEISDGGGWVTATTRERLASLPGVNLRISKGEWILNGNKWDGKWITIS